MVGSAVRSADVYRGRVYENEGIPELVGLVDPTHARVIDLGCGVGANMSLLRERGHEVTGVTLSEDEATLVRSRGFRCLVCDVANENVPLPAASADALLFSHVLEHLAWPEEALRRSLKLLRPGGGVYVALPNALQFRQRWEFFRGRFRYVETGITDRTHLRFFDFHSARELLEGAGVRVSRHLAVGHVPLGPVRRAVGSMAPRLDRLASRLRPGFFGFHILLAGTWGAGPSP